MEFTHLDLFSGIGGFALAARWAGIKTVQFVEIDPFCQKVLQKNFPGVPIYDDIKTFHNTTNATNLCSGDSQQRDAPSQGSGECITAGGEVTNSSINGGCGNCNTSKPTRSKKSGIIQGEENDIKSFTYANWNGLQEPRPEQQASGNRQLLQASTESTGRKSREQTEQEGGQGISRGNQERPFLLTGGFPCQPFSCAGKRRGKEDDRYLWEEMLRVIKEFKPTWIIGENVAGINSLFQYDSFSEMEGKEYLTPEDAKADFKGISERTGTNSLWVVLDDLEKIGYAVQAFIIPACAVNAPHRRDRVWIVGHLVGHTTGAGVGIGQQKRMDGQIHEATGRVESSDRANASDSHAPDTSRELSHRGGEPRGRRGEFADNGFTFTDPRDTGLQGCERPGSHGEGQAAHGSIAERNHTWDEPWIEAASRLCRVDARVSNRVDRLKALGNAIVPQVASEIMKAILKVSNG